MAMWQIIRHFFWVAASGFSLPRGLGSVCLDARHCAFFICRFSQVLMCSRWCLHQSGCFNDASLKRFIAERYLEINGYRAIISLVVTLDR